MAYRLRIETKRGPKGLRRVYRQAREEALRAAGEFWTRELLPRHFAADATSRYRYAKRSKAHERRKSREGRSANPNVYTGRLMQKMLSMVPTMKIGPRGLELIWRGLPRYTYVVDTIEWVTSDRRWDDGFLEILRARGDTKAVAGILKWREAHPQTKDGRFKRVQRPDKPRELTAMNRQDADAIGKAFRAVFDARIKEML